ncbi:MAG: PilZ domain-containing protein [Candidatus Omnitrophica bacterium]|nr:PilZ domain-containing protein [Candidatus Omnitrophota bacterium]
MGKLFDSPKVQEDERRKYVRVPTNLYVAYTLPDSGRKEAGLFLTKNVSGGGLLIETFWEIPPGTILDLSIHLPTTFLPLSAKGKVVRVRKTRPYGRYDVGLSLIEISEKERRALIKYLVSIIFSKADYESLFRKEEYWENLLFESTFPLGSESHPLGA